MIMANHIDREIIDTIMEKFDVDITSEDNEAYLYYESVEFTNFKKPNVRYTGYVIMSEIGFIDWEDEYDEEENDDGCDTTARLFTFDIISTLNAKIKKSKIVELDLYELQ